MSDKLTQAQEELSFIKNIIQDSREKFYDTGSHLILWGVLVALGQLSNYFTYKLSIGEYLGYIWLGLIMFGWCGGFILGKREREKMRPDNFASRIAQSLWISGGISMTIIGFAAAVHFTQPVIINAMAINPVISIILGILYFTTGALYDLRWFSRIAYGWWLVGVTLFYWKSNEGFVLYAIVVVLFMVIPGIILNRNFNRVKSSELEVD